MTAPFYTPTGTPIQGSKGQSSAMRTEFAAIEAAIDLANEIPVTLSWNDVNAGDPAASLFVAAPWACRIKRIYAANDVANTVTPTILTLEIGGTLVTMPALQWGATDAIGTVISSIPTANHTVAGGSTIELITNSGGSAVMPAHITLVLERT